MIPSKDCFRSSKVFVSTLEECEKKDDDDDDDDEDNAVISKLSSQVLPMDRLHSPTNSTKSCWTTEVPPWTTTRPGVP